MTFRIDVHAVHALHSNFIENFSLENIFYNLVPSFKETSFQPPSIVCISVIIHITHYKLQIPNGPLCAAFMYYLVHLFLDMWLLIFVVFLCCVNFCVFEFAPNRWPRVLYINTPIAVTPSRWVDYGDQFWIQPHIRAHTRAT